MRPHASERRGRDAGDARRLVRTGRPYSREAFGGLAREPVEREVVELDRQSNVAGLPAQPSDLALLSIDVAGVGPACAGLANDPLGQLGVGGGRRDSSTPRERVLGLVDELESPPDQLGARLI